MPVLDNLWWTRAQAIPANNADAVVANLTNDAPSPSATQRAVHIDWSRNNNATALRDFVDAPADGAGGLWRSTIKVKGDVDGIAADGPLPPSSTIIAPHGEVIHIDWSRNNNATAVRDFADDNGVSRNRKGMLRSTFAVLGDAAQQQSAGRRDSGWDAVSDSINASLLAPSSGSSAAAVEPLAWSGQSSAPNPSYLTAIKSDRSNVCAPRLEGFEACLSANNGDADRCSDAWERFVSCQEIRKSQSHYSRHYY